MNKYMHSWGICTEIGTEGDMASVWYLCEKEEIPS